MKKQLFGVAAALFLTCAQAQAHGDMKCTDKPKEQWLPVFEIQKKIVNEHGFAIKKFMEAGTCYEIYGWALGKDGKNIDSVEVYFNPVTGEIVKKKFKD